MTNKKLMNMAKEALKNSHSPYSNYAVGACVECEDGKVYSGCNIENASYGATICAERTAIFKAISEGSKRLKRIAVCDYKGTTAWPCGVCRQVMSEFGDENMVIVLEKDNELIEFKLKELLPHSFNSSNLE